MIGITDICPCGHIRLWHDPYCTERFCECMAFQEEKGFAILSIGRPQVAIQDWVRLSLAMKSRVVGVFERRQRRALGVVR